MADSNKELRRENKVTLEGKIIRQEVIQTAKGDLLKGTLMFGGSKDTGANFINFILWKPDVNEVELVENAVDNKSVVKVEGYLRQNKWEDRSGNKRSVHELGVNNINVSDNQPPQQTRKSEGENTKAGAPPSKKVTPPAPADDDIPF